MSAYLDGPKEVVIVGPDADPLLAVLREQYLPNRALVVVASSEELIPISKIVPFVEGKVARGGKATAYVCKRGACKLPTSSPALLSRQLTEVKPLFAR